MQGADSTLGTRELLPSHFLQEPSALRRRHPKPRGPCISRKQLGLCDRLSTSEHLITLQPWVGFPFPALSSHVPPSSSHPKFRYPSPCQLNGLAQLSGGS